MFLESATILEVKIYNFVQWKWFTPHHGWTQNWTLNKQTTEEYIRNGLIHTKYKLCKV